MSALFSQFDKTPAADRTDRRTDKNVMTNRLVLILGMPRTVD